MVRNLFSPSFGFGSELLGLGLHKKLGEVRCGIVPFFRGF